MNKEKLLTLIQSPYITEKSSAAGELNQVVFKVALSANKLEIKKAVESFYGVTVTNVNTSVVPGKNKTRTTKSGFIAGRKPAYKKAFVTVAEGETIDLYTTI